MILYKDVKATLYANFIKFSSEYVACDRGIYNSRITTYVAYIADCDGVDYSNNYESLSDLLQDFYYCSF